MSKSYESLFIDFLKDAIAECMGVVQQSQALLSDELREQAWHVLSYALKDSSLWTQTRDLVLNLAPKMEQAGFRNDWMTYLESGIHQAEMHDDHAAIAEFELQVALLRRMLSNYDVAVQWLEKSYQHFRHAGDKRGQARVYNELAWVEQLRRNYDVATQQVEQALALLDEDDPELGMSYRVQGMIAVYQGRWQKAEGYHRAALAVFERARDERKTAWSMQNLALALRGQEKYTTAIEYLSHASKIMQQMEDLHNWSIAQINLGTTYYYYGKIDKAITCYLSAEHLVRQFHDKLRLADIHTNLGLAYLAQSENDLASNSFQTAMTLFGELGITSMVVNSMDGLAMSYIARRQYERAFSVLQEAIGKLPQIVNAPNYQYYQHSLNQHLEDAKVGLGLSFTPKADIV